MSVKCMELSLFRTSVNSVGKFKIKDAINNIENSNMATWFCWGTTHFCDKCHRKQVETQALTKTPKNQLPKCLGVGKCPTGGNHADNGEECILGCSLCTGTNY